MTAYRIGLCCIKKIQEKIPSKINSSKISTKTSYVKEKTKLLSKKSLYVKLIISSPQSGSQTIYL